MNIGAFLIGALLAISLFLFIKNFKKYTTTQRIVAIVVILLVIYCIFLYLLDSKSITFDAVSVEEYVDFIIDSLAEKLPWTIAGAVVGLVLNIIYSLFFINSKIYKLINKEIQVDFLENSNISGEDFMNTKLGKIVTIVVVILVIYAIASTACIFRLNQKINSMVVITDELREEINR